MFRTATPRRAGFTLIEISIVLGVLAIVMAAIWLVVGTVFENVKHHKAGNEMQQIVQNVRQLTTRISAFSSTSGDITAAYDNQGAFPVEMRINEANGNGNLNHPWSNAGNAVDLTIEGRTTFGIKFRKLPKKACISLATKLSSGELSGLEAVVINGTSNSGTALPLNVVTASTQCTQSTATNTILWKFNLRGT